MLSTRRIRLPRDRDTVIAFRRDSFLVSYGDLELMGSDEQYLSLLTQRQAGFPEGFLLVDDADGRPIGQLEARLRDFGRGRLDGYVNLYYFVASERRRGYGRWLHDHAVRLFRDHGCDRMCLKVSSTNEAARSFYKALGFEEIGSELEGKVRLLELSI